MIRGAESTVERLQACVNSNCLFASRAKFSSLPRPVLLASISATLAQSATDTPCFEPSEGAPRGASLLGEQQNNTWNRPGLPVVSEPTLRAR